MVFPVVMYGCESWTVKKAECWRIDAFELWCWRRLLRGPWTARTSNQSILKEVSPGISLEGMTLKLKLQYFGHRMRRVDSLEKTLMLGKIEAGGEGDDRSWDGWMASLTRWNWVGWTLGVGDGQGGLACCDSWGCKESDTAERLNWTEDRGIWSHHFMANRWGNSGNNSWLYFSGLQNHCRWWLQPWNEKTLTPWKESYDQPGQHIKNQRCYFAKKGPSSQGYGFSSSHVWLWELYYKER